MAMILIDVFAQAFLKKACDSPHSFFDIQFLEISLTKMETSWKMFLLSRLKAFTSNVFSFLQILLQ